MSQFTTDPIETLEDWNAVLTAGCCCVMPTCPTPTMECESRSGEASRFGYGPVAEPAGISTDDIPTLWENSTFNSYFTELGTVWGYNSGPGTYPLSGELNSTRTVDVTNITGVVVDLSNTIGGGNSHDELLDSCEAIASVGEGTPSGGYGDPVITHECEPDRHAQVGTQTWIEGTPGPFPLLGCPGPFAFDDKFACNLTYTEYAETTLSDSFTKADLVAEAETDMGAWPEPAEGELCASSAVFDWPTIGDPAPWPDCSAGEPANFSFTPDVNISQARFKWVISNVHEGTYFKISWDIVFFPTTGDPELVSSDTWEWAGPGDPEDEETWKSAWYEIPVPTEDGENRVVNIRFECYRGPYGAVPQVTGEAVTIADP